MDTSVHENKAAVSDVYILVLLQRRLVLNVVLTFIFIILLLIYVVWG